MVEAAGQGWQHRQRPWWRSGEEEGDESVYERGESSSLSMSPLSLNSSTSHRHLAAFLVCLAGGGEAVGEGCGNGDDGASGEDGAGGAGAGGCARFIGRDSQVASWGAFGSILALTGPVATRLRWRRRGSSDRGLGKQTGQSDLVLTCDVADGDTGLEPAGHASLIQCNEVASGHYIRRLCWRWRRSQSRPVSNNTCSRRGRNGELGVGR
jgi:hypothetical protein